jgi:hypothetical protein
MPPHVLGVVQRGLDHRLAHERPGCAVQDRLDLLVAQQSLECVAVAQGPTDESGAVDDRSSVPGDQRVEHDRLVAGLDQPLDGHAPNVPRPARDQDLHRITTPLPLTRSSQTGACQAP